MSLPMSLRTNKRYYPVTHAPRKRQRRASPSATPTAHLASLHNSKTLFFRLPRELRDSIYEYVLNAEDDFLFRYLSIPILARRPHLDLWILPRTYGLPAWLRSSREILREGMETLHRTREFLGVNNFLVELDTDGAALHRPASRNPLLFNERIRRVGFHQGRREVGIRREAKGVGAAMYWRPTREEERFVAYLSRVGVQDLEVSIAFSHTVELGVWTRESVKRDSRLRLFDVLGGRCRRVEIDMGLYTSDVLECKLTEEVLEEAGRVVGGVVRRMVGGDGVVTEVRWEKTMVGRMGKVRLPIMPSFRGERVERG